MIAHNCNVLEKNTIKIISNWQKMSYSSKMLNCQFYPSCSNYFSLSIAKKGIIKGTIIGLDRIVRCNPAAVGYHFQQSDPEFYYDGRLVDNFEYNKHHHAAKWPVYLSIIPGMGRVYLGHKFDGFVSLTFVSLFSGISYSSFNNNNNLLGFITGTLASFFWAADYYGAYRTSFLYKH